MLDSCFGDKKLLMLSFWKLISTGTFPGKTQCYYDCQVVGDFYRVLRITERTDQTNY